MAASIRSLPLSPPLSSPYASTRHLATSPPSCRSCRRGLGFSGVRAAAEPVEVVGIGSRKEAVIDFCLGSRTLSSIPIRFCDCFASHLELNRLWFFPRDATLEVFASGATFWFHMSAIPWVVAADFVCTTTIHRVAQQFRYSWYIRCTTLRTILVMNNSKVQLTQRSHGADVVVRNLEPPLSLHPCPPAFILVASAGQDFDRIMAMELLNAVKSSGKLAASIFLKPFCFEGQRRQVEATDLISKLQVCSNFHIVIEADSLLETEVETLAEALESANNAVLSTISLISIMMSGFSQMFRSSLDAQIKEVDLEEVGKLLKSYGEARVGFGAGYNIQSAIKQAVFHCPFLRGGIKDLNNVVFLSLTSARIMDESDIISTLHIFRRVTGFTKDIIFCRNSEPDLEPKLVVITLLTVGCDKNVGSVTVKEGFLSSLALHFPFISSLTRGYSPEEEHTMSKHSFGQPADGGSSSSEQEPSSFFSAFTGSASVANLFSEKENIKSVSFRESNDGNERTHLESLEANFESDGIIGKDTDKEQLGLWQEHGFWSSMPSFGIAQMWAKERAATNGSNQSNELNNFTLPVGVKSSEIQYDHSLTTWADTSNATCSTSLAAGHAAFGASLTDVGLEKAMEICSSAMSFLKGRMDGSQKRGLLASRAAAMLDAERESEKMWSPIVEIKYGGGTYRGRCQEGVPEGKGRLTFRDGSFYDGLWRYGKRAGLGTFCYSNGDVFHGTWRDDLIHGKGWFYFHGGDRWFANFWKGKANGEGRFYSKDGSIFFGHFQNGWRHGESLWIDANGSRWVEVWDEGVLVSQTKLEK